MSKQFKVIRIINEQRIVLNAGRRDGINESAVFEIVGFSQPLIDPDSGEDLGSIEISKAKVSILELKEKFCICQNAQVESPISLQISESMSAMSRSLAKRPPLNVDAFEMMDVKRTQESAIRIGDIARIVE